MLAELTESRKILALVVESMTLMDSFNLVCAFAPMFSTAAPKGMVSGLVLGDRDEFQLEERPRPVDFNLDTQGAPLGFRHAFKLNPGHNFDYLARTLRLTQSIGYQQGEVSNRL